MKIRNGFVSNSSSSSFVMVGVKIPDTDQTIDEMKAIMETAGFDWAAQVSDKEWYDAEKIEKDVEAMHEFYYEEFIHAFLSKGKFMICSGSEDGVDGTVMGKELAATGSGEYFDSLSLLPADIDKIGKEVKEKFNIDGEVRLFIGTRMC